ncbi:MAG: hypothetical protein AAF368_13305 [Planctomycetota bacterium]
MTRQSKKDGTERRTGAAELSEEAAGILRVVVERQAYRQLMSANIRGHGLKFVPSIEQKAVLSEDLVHSLKIYSQVEQLYHSLGGSDLHDEVRSRMESIPYPSSRLEFSVCLVLCDLAERVASRSYVDSVSKEFAAIARSLLEMNHVSTPVGADLFVEYACDSANLPHARQMFDRWFEITLRSLGRPGTKRDDRAVELGLRSTHCGDKITEFVEEVRKFLAPTQLTLPNPEALGLDLPAALFASEAS